MQNVIIGGGAAGYHAAKVLAQAGEQVTIVSKEAEPFYSRVLISHYLGGEVERESLFLAGKDCYDVLGVTALMGRRVVQVDVRNKRINLDDGQVLPFDQLLVASGGEPLAPALSGKELAGVFTLYKLADAEAIKSWVQPGEPAVIIGGGLVACRAAEALHALGVPVTMVEIMGHLLPQVLDRTAAGLLHETLTEAGFKLYLEDSVETIEGKERVERVKLRSGVVIPCHLVIVATGTRPALDFLANTGIKVNRGVVVNEYLESSIPGIYAAGDVAEVYDVAWGEHRINALWPHAVVQGRLAGSNMAGKRQAYPGSIGVNTMEIFGLRIVSFGITQAMDGYQHSCNDLK